MQTFAVAATFAAVASASASDFPKFDSLHAHCEMYVTYPKTTCSVTYNLLDHEIRSWASGDVGGGLYAVKEEAEFSYIWSTRTTPVHRYVDDQIFELTQVGADCQVHARSRSQTNSYYDYDTNYCNMWNPLHEIASFTNLSTKNCQFKPDDAAATCAIY